MQRKQCHVVPETGSHVCETIGTCKSSIIIITPRACARGNVIGFVCRLSSVVCRLSSVVSTKIARSGDLGI